MHLNPTSACPEGMFSICGLCTHIIACRCLMRLPAALSLLLLTPGRCLPRSSGDATARIWNVSMGDSQVPMVCDHNIDASQNNSRSKDVTTLDWSPDGELLATGCYDGWARVFSKTGAMQGGSCVLEPPCCRLGPVTSMLRVPGCMLRVPGGMAASLAARHPPGCALGAAQPGDATSLPCVLHHLRHAWAQHTRRRCRPCTAGSRSRALACHPSCCRRACARAQEAHGPHLQPQVEQEGHLPAVWQRGPHSHPVGRQERRGEAAVAAAQR